MNARRLSERARSPGTRRLDEKRQGPQTMVGAQPLRGEQDRRAPETKRRVAQLAWTSPAHPSPTASLPSPLGRPSLPGHKGPERTKTPCGQRRGEALGWGSSGDWDQEQKWPWCHRVCPRHPCTPAQGEGGCGEPLSPAPAPTTLPFCPRPLSKQDSRSCGCWQGERGPQLSGEWGLLTQAHTGFLHSLLGPQAEPKRGYGEEDRWGRGVPGSLPPLGGFRELGHCL